MDRSRFAFGLVLIAAGALVLGLDLARLRQQPARTSGTGRRGGRTVLRRIATPLLAVGVGWVVVALL
jgi:hypothetical protein